MTKYPAFQSEVLDHQQRSAKGVTPEVLLQVESEKEASRAGLRGETPLCPTLPFPTREPGRASPSSTQVKPPRSIWGAWLCPVKETGVTVMLGKPDGEAAPGWLPPPGKNKGCIFILMSQLWIPRTVFKIFLSGGQSAEER